MWVYNKYKKEKNILKRLRDIQNEIGELEHDIVLPTLKQYTGSTRTFPGGDMEVFKYIYDVMRGHANPLYPPNTTYGLVGGNCIFMWECFSEYFKNLSQYCKHKEENIYKIKQLKNEEKKLKKDLGIN